MQPDSKPKQGHCSFETSSIFDTLRYKSATMEKFEINIEAFGRLTEEEFFHFCQDNHHLRIERDHTGKIIIMSPTGSKTGL